MDVNVHEGLSNFALDRDYSQGTAFLLLSNIPESFSVKIYIKYAQF